MLEDSSRRHFYFCCGHYVTNVTCITVNVRSVPVDHMGMGCFYHDTQTCSLFHMMLGMDGCEPFQLDLCMSIYKKWIADYSQCQAQPDKVESQSTFCKKSSLFRLGYVLTSSICSIAYEVAPRKKRLKRLLGFIVNWKPVGSRHSSRLCHDWRQILKF